MRLSTDTAHIQSQIEVQMALAALAAIDKIRAMHEDLERLYRAQLVALVAAERLAVAVDLRAARPDAAGAGCIGGE